MHEPRDYQIAACEALFAHIKEGGHSGVIQAATGAGKSLIIALTVGLLKQFRILVLCHNAEVLQSNFDTYEEDDKSMYCAGLKQRNIEARVVFSSRDSYVRVRQRRDFDIVIVDECHLVNLSGDTSYSKILSRTNHRYLLGLTATPYRMDNGLVYGTGKPFEKLLFSIGTQFLIDRGLLSEYTWPEIEKSVDVSKVKKIAGDFDAEAQAALYDEPIVAEAIKRWQMFDRKLTLFFCCSVAHAELVHKCIPESILITGETPAHERQVIIADIKAGKYRAVINVAVMTTGVNIPEIDCIVFMRATQSASLFVQCLDDQTEVLTKEYGWLNHHSFVEGSLHDTTCVAFEESTGEIIDAKILNIVKRKTRKEEKMCYINTPRQNINVTDGHRMLMRTSTERPWQFKTAKECTEYKEMYQVPISGIRKNPDANLTDDEIQFIGWCISDGSIQKHNVVISQSKPQYVKEIRDLLNRLGMRFGEHVVDGDTNFKRNYPNHRFSISYSIPRRLDERHLKGCGQLQRWLNKKDLSNLSEFSERQFDILLQTIIKADGNINKNPTSKGKSYTQKSFVICKSQSYIDQLQALCVQFGWRADITSVRNQQSTILSVSKSEFKYIGGKNNYDRDSLHTIDSNERFVWCVENTQGTLITRRRGRVTIMGNCLGRGLRTAPGKTDCLILDFAGNYERFGHPDNPMVIRKGKTNREEIIEEMLDGLLGPIDGKFDAPTKTCPECDTIWPVAKKKCGVCGKLFLSHTEDVFSDKDWIAVQNAWLESKTTRKGANAIVVNYATKERRYQEWFVDGQEWQRQKKILRIQQVKSQMIEAIKVKMNASGWPQITSVKVKSSQPSSSSFALTASS